MLDSLHMPCKTPTMYLETLKPYLKRAEAYADRIGSEESPFALYFPFIHKFELFIIHAKLFDGCSQFEQVFL